MTAYRDRMNAGLYDPDEKVRAKARARPDRAPAAIAKVVEVKAPPKENEALAEAEAPK